MTALAMAPVYRHGMSIERVEWHLWNWEQFMHRRDDEYRPATAEYEGYNSRSSCGGSTNSREFDAMVADADRRCAEAVSAVVDDLPVALHIAVYQTHRLVAACARMRSPVADLYDQALVIIARGLTAKGIE